MNKAKTLAFTLLFLIIGGALMLYGLSFEIPNYDPVRWGLLVIGYVFFGVLGTGVSTYNSLYRVFKWKDQEGNPLHKLSSRLEWLALALLVPGWIMVFASVYKPLEMTYIYTSFNSYSRIAWNGVLYLLVGVGIILSILALMGEKKDTDRPVWNKVIKLIAVADVGIILYTIAADLILDANLGAVFGYLSTWVLDFGAFVPMMYVVLSFYGGIAALSLVSYAYWALSRKDDGRWVKPVARDGLIATLVLSFMFAWWMWIMMTNQEAWPWTSLLYSGPYFKLLWDAVVFAGLLVPIISYLVATFKSNRHALLIGSIGSLVGMFSIVYTSVIIPQIITWYYSNSPISPSGSTWLYELRTYLNGASPYSLLQFTIIPHDLYIFVGGAIFFMAMVGLGALLLPLEEDEKPKHWFFR
ncbi:MAG: sulfur reduction protein DsrP [Nitrososphaera sp.]|nr:MAG: sulfur reduction protein DsrP [Nitrososphaera sp.]